MSSKDCYGIGFSPVVKRVDHIRERMSEEDSYMKMEELIATQLQFELPLAQNREN